MWERVMDVAAEVDTGGSFEIVHVKSKDGDVYRGKRHLIESFPSNCSPLPSEGKVRKDRLSRISIGSGHFDCYSLR